MTTSLLLLLCAIPTALGFATPSRGPSRPLNFHVFAKSKSLRRSPSSTSFGPTRLFNIYDDWAGDLLSSSQSEYTYDELTLPLDEDSIEQCLEELMDSEYGKTMFGRHDMPASVGITGSVEFDSLDGPEAILSLTGKFWHRRDTVLGKAAMYLNARIPELTSVRVSSPEELSDFEEIVDEFTGAVVGREDKRSPDFNGDRETMEYQGLDPDARGPFVFSAGGGSMIRPA
eukprot:CAMPEP_0172534556 /NCGR_PEP_ID=MMETSP1067-20121228/6877_1 /TAXON_ID=265564 ORGANISM="Thalassiosira punctigera, Strain Tpunct2005C2" /NCGR_SAMPLE_ID=MMETSP1067 /ASSEMBLY_ACC=CAM_ASM_000444 /LENGTH=228 /DNA_ID=CAMNT_0013319363 /DNA_START=8 /DNA_END=694 /DNA_ORIENTATION=-